MSSGLNLRRKIKSVSNTRQITRAMQMVAATKMRRAQEAAVRAHDYYAAGYEILAHLQRSNLGSPISPLHPLQAERQVNRRVLVAIGSDRGLAGPFNSNIIRLTLDRLREHSASEISVVTIGRKIQEGLRRQGVAVKASFNGLPTNPVSGDISPVAKLTIDSFLVEQADSVEIIYTEFHSTLNQSAVCHQLLPARFQTNNTADSSYANEYLIEPARPVALDYIVPRMVELQLYLAFLDSAAAEHSARMLAMKSATDNANDMIDDLKLTYNSLRQSAITAEIAEISSGAAAL